MKHYDIYIYIKYYILELNGVGQQAQQNRSKEAHLHHQRVLAQAQE